MLGTKALSSKEDHATGGPAIFTEVAGLKVDKELGQRQREMAPSRTEQKMSTMQ